MAEKKSNKKTNTFLSVLMYACLILGWYILMYPTVADLFNKAVNQNTILAYNNSMVSYSDEEIEAMITECKAYNNTIYEEQKTSTFRYRGDKATDETYESLPTKSTEIGYLRIPSINVNVAIGHGTNSAMLQQVAGHLYGTSLPIEGDNVHAVIGAHSALSTAKLFTDLEKLEEGDEFYVTVLNQQCEYKIDQIVTVLPEDDYLYEQIEEGKNYVSLYTCTPYGINTHRILVRGELVGITTVQGGDDGWDLSAWIPIIIDGALIALILCLPYALILIKAHRNKKKTKQKQKDNASKEAGNTQTSLEDLSEDSKLTDTHSGSAAKEEIHEISQKTEKQNE